LHPLLIKELWEVLTGRAFWTMLLMLCPLVGYSFVQAVSLYGEASTAAQQSPVLAASLSPLDGVLVPTLGAFYVAITLLFPFVAIRVLGQEKDTGALRLLVQLPYRSLTLVSLKLVAVLAAWALVSIPALSALAIWVILGGHLALFENRSPGPVDFLGGDTLRADFFDGGNEKVADFVQRAIARHVGVGGEQAWIVLEVPQPFPNHKGGQLAFGPDGDLYIGFGDGGSQGDPNNRAQNLNDLLGKLLRIDVDGASPYAIPPSNPFVGRAGARPEVWAYGLRNPWRYSFDRVTGDLWIADVGQNAWEEIDYEPPRRGGRNYGWRNREGAHTHIASPAPAFQPLVDPIFEYSHADGQSITGGYVYRGRALGAEYQGRYFFADFIFGRVWSIALTVDAAGNAAASDRIEHTAELGGPNVLGNISSFGVNADDELFIVNYAGTILRVVNPSAAPATPMKLGVIR